MPLKRFCAYARTRPHLEDFLALRTGVYLDLRYAGLVDVLRKRNKLRFLKGVYFEGDEYRFL